MSQPPIETLELRLTDAQIEAIRQRHQRRTRSDRFTPPEFGREKGEIDLGCIDSEPVSERKL